MRAAGMAGHGEGWNAYYQHASHVIPAKAGIYQGTSDVYRVFPRESNRETFMRV